jgi:alpha-beta hydrolase superfamily lysophospholipase
LAETVTYFWTNDQLELSFKTTLVDSSRASIVFVHGVGEHIGRYAEVFQAFSEQGYSCFGFDQRGFGRSEGERGHINTFSDYVEDLAKFIDDIVCQESKKAVFILGHSMGSIVALAYVLKYSAKIQGLLLFSCPIKLDSYLANLGGFIAKGCSAFIPHFKVPNFIDPQALSNNLTNIQAFTTDPYAVNQVSINWLREFTLARTTVLNHAQEIMLPVLINHGKADTIASLSGAKALFAALGTQDKTLLIYPGLKHELLNHCPAERAKVLEQTFAWLKQQCETKTI